MPAAVTFATVEIIDAAPSTGEHAS
jgi:hypothetical protein